VWLIEGMIAIRPARPADADTLFRFIRELAEYEREPDAVQTSPVALAAQLAEEPPPFECLIAERDDAPVGFALFFHNYSTWRGRRGLYLEDLYVSPSHRGRGVGKRLLVELARVATERGCARLEWSVLDWNQPAIEFYRALGATPMDEWTVFRLTDEPLDALATGASPAALATGASPGVRRR
jgi:GNAT superfamily N-acetyltransferase